MIEFISNINLNPEGQVRISTIGRDTENPWVIMRKTGSTYPSVDDLKRSLTRGGFHARAIEVLRIGAIVGGAALLTAAAFDIAFPSQQGTQITAGIILGVAGLISGEWTKENRLIVTSRIKAFNNTFPQLINPGIRDYLSTRQKY